MDEQQIQLSDVPQNVLNAANAAVPGIVFQEAEFETEDGVSLYELEGIANGQEYEVAVSSAGQVLEIELEDEEGGEDDDGEDDDEDEQEIALSDVPQNVLNAAMAAVPGVVLEEAELETENGVTVYGLEGQTNGRETEIEVTAAGEVLEISQELALTDVPQNVLDAATAAVPGISFEEAELETEAGVTTYELEGTANGQEYEIAISPTGEVLELESEGSDDDDTLTGADSDDVMLGQGGNDTIRSLSGNDAINGNQGDDLLMGDAGDDIIGGGQGNDLVLGGAGNDVLRGDRGNDIVNGGQGNDLIEGGDGNDILNGGQGNDMLVGGNGNDIIDGDFGADALIGGGGADSFIVDTVDAMDLVVDFNAAEGDRVLVSMEILEQFTLQATDTNGDSIADAVEMIVGGNSIVRFEGVADPNAIAAAIVPDTSGI